MTHIIKLKGKKIELTTDQAQRLYEELHAIFGKPTEIHLPFIPSPPMDELNPPWTITCGCGCNEAPSLN